MATARKLSQRSIALNIDEPLELPSKVEAGKQIEKKSRFATLSGKERPCYLSRLCNRYVTQTIVIRTVGLVQHDHVKERRECTSRPCFFFFSVLIYAYHAGVSEVDKQRSTPLPLPLDEKDADMKKGAVEGMKRLTHIQVVQAPQTDQKDFRSRMVVWS